MKTAMQELIDDLKKNNPHHYNDNKKWFDSLLEKEKEQITNSFIDGTFWELYGYNITQEERAEKYYNKKFKNK